MVLLKKAQVLARVLYELIQQEKSNYEELEQDCPVLLEVENIIGQLHEDVARHSEALLFVISGLEAVREICVRLENNRSKLLFRPGPLLDKMMRLENKLYAMVQRIATEGQPSSIQMEEGHLSNGHLPTTNEPEIVRSDSPQLQDIRPNGKIPEDQDASVEPKHQRTISVIDLVILHPTAREFWLKHFGAQTHNVKWDAFKNAFEKDYGTQLVDNLKRLKKHLDCDHSSNDEISIFEYADFTDQEGLPDSFNHLTQRASCTFNPYIEPEDQTPTQTIVTEEEQKESEALKANPIQPNSVWQGVATEGGCETLDMTFHINEREDNQIYGEILWSGDVLTKFRGEIHNDTITFNEYKVKKGVNIIPFPNSYIGTVDFANDTIKGKWTYNDQQGNFHLHFHLEATQRMAHAEKKELMDQEQQQQQQITYCGYLQKQSHGITRKWQHRFFVMDNSSLNYCKSKSRYPHKVTGRIPMSYVLTLHDHPDVSKPLAFDLVTSDRTYHLQAENEKEKLQWIAVIKDELNKYQTEKSLDVFNV